MDGKKVPLWKEDAIRIEALYSDFDGDVSRWKDSFYELWRYQMGYEFTYDIALVEYRNRGVAVVMHIKPKFEKNVSDLMKELGYQKIRKEAVKVGIIDSCDLYDIDPAIDDVFQD